MILARGVTILEPVDGGAGGAGGAVEIRIAARLGTRSIAGARNSHILGAGRRQASGPGTRTPAGAKRGRAGGRQVGPK